MAGIEDFDCEGTLSIGGISLTRPAWTVQADENGNGGLLPLLTTARQRGSDRVLPGANGVIPYRRRITITNHRFRIVVASDVQPDGTASVLSPKAQLVVNLKYLYDNLIVPTGTGDGTRAVSVVIPGPFTGTGFMHVTELSLTQYAMAENGAIAVGQIDASIPAGRLAWA